MMTAVVVEGSGLVDRLMRATAEGGAATAEGVLERGVGVRWPNDVMVEGRKLAGVLVERVGEAALVGIGLNVGLGVGALPDDVRQTATSLGALGCGVDRLAVLDRLLGELDKAFGASDAALREAWRRRNTLTAQRLTVESDGRVIRGRVIDIDPDRGLVMEVEGGGVVTLGASVTSLVHGAD